MASEEVAMADANLREVARLRTAVQNAQALASHWQGVCDTQRAQLDAAQRLAAENAALKRWLILAVAAWRAERGRVRALEHATSLLTTLVWRFADGS